MCRLVGTQSGVTFCKLHGVSGEDEVWAESCWLAVLCRRERGGHAEGTACTKWKEWGEGDHWAALYILETNEELTCSSLNSDLRKVVTGNKTETQAEARTSGLCGHRGLHPAGDWEPPSVCLATLKFPVGHLVGCVKGRGPREKEKSCITMIQMRQDGLRYLQ